MSYALNDSRTRSRTKRFLACLLSRSTITSGSSSPAAIMPAATDTDVLMRFIEVNFLRADFISFGDTDMTEAKKKRDIAPARSGGITLKAGSSMKQSLE